MSLAVNLGNLATRVATEAKALRTLLNGNAVDNSALITTAKGNLVAAINEVAAAVAGASGIDDGVIGTTTSWSSAKTRDEIDAGVASIDLTDVINDAATATTTTWSSTKIDAEITEVGDAVAAIDLTDLIDDVTPGTDTVYSSTKTDAQIATAVGGVDLTDLIDDVTPSTSSVYSSTKTATEIAAAVAALVDGAPTDLNTLNELAAALADDDSAIAAITTALGNRVRVDTAAQGLNSTQQGNARTNIAAASAADLATLTSDVGDTTTNFVTIFEAGL